MKRVAAYCRVSTDYDDQVNSLASQKKYFREYIECNPQWELAQIFADTGITGTSTKKRAAFNQMIGEALAGKFQLILTKEISRFARNTLDSIYYTRMLKEHGIGVIFMNDNINTMDCDAELRLTIMSSIAQEESRKTSERVKWGQKRRMEQGVVFGRDLLGYDVRNGRLHINEEGAATVRLIFHKYVNEGKGAYIIARELREAGIKTSPYMKQWSGTGILRILKNEKVVGDLVQKKTFTPSYLNHEKKYNTGQEELVVISNHHQPIISRELFQCAQEELKRRAPSPEQKSKYTSRYCFSGKIKCTPCKCTYVSRAKKRKDGSIYNTWRCYQGVCGTKNRNGEGKEAVKCPSVRDEDLKEILLKILKSLHLEQTSCMNKIKNAAAEVLQAGFGEEGLKEQEQCSNLLMKKQRLIDLYIAKEITKEEFDRLREKYERNISLLQEKDNKQTHNQNKSHTALADIGHTIESLMTGEAWDDILYRNILNLITVDRDNTITVRLKCLSCQWTASLIKL